MTSSRPDDQDREPAHQPTYNPSAQRRRGYQRESLGEAIAKSFIRSVASSLGRIIVRTILGRRR